MACVPLPCGLDRADSEADFAGTPRGARLLEADLSRRVAASRFADDWGTRLWNAGAPLAFLPCARPCPWRALRAPTRGPSAPAPSTFDSGSRREKRNSCGCGMSKELPSWKMTALKLKRIKY